MGIFGGCLRK